MAVPLEDNSILILSKKNNKEYIIRNYEGARIRWNKSFNSILKSNRAFGEIEDFSSFYKIKNEISFVLTTSNKKKVDYYLVTINGLLGDVIHFKKITSLSDDEVATTQHIKIKPLIMDLWWD